MSDFFKATHRGHIKTILHPPQQPDQSLMDPYGIQHRYMHDKPLPPTYDT